MQTDYLIVGQGLSGTWLSYWLVQGGAHVLVIDDNASSTASKTSSGLINPVTGRRMVETWMADTLLPFAHQAYQSMAAFLSHHAESHTNDVPLAFITGTTITDFFTAPDRRLAFEKRAAENDQYLHWPMSQQHWEDHFHYNFGYGQVCPVYTVPVQQVLAQWRHYLGLRQWLITDTFAPLHLKVNARGIKYQDIAAKAIIFCDGPHAQQSPYFALLPFALNKGEALMVQIPGLPEGPIFKKGLTIMPMGQQQFWVGSNYAWHYDDAHPTAAFKTSTEQWLQQTIRHPFTTLQHWAALRPANVERRPFVGMHPLHPNLGILNGMGTKGVSLAPYFARQLAQHLIHGTPIMPEASIDRFQRLLQR